MVDTRTIVRRAVGKCLGAPYGNDNASKDHVSEYGDFSKDFKDNMSKLDKIEILRTDKLPDIKTKGNALAKGVLSVFGGNDLTPEGARVLKDTKDILALQPGLIRHVPPSHAKLVLEYMRQNLGNKYDELTSLWNMSHEVK